MCRESIDSDFLRFLLGSRVDDYNARDGWYVPGSGCRLGHGRPLVCYEFFCASFGAHDWNRLKQLSRAFKRIYAGAYAGQHMLVVEDIGKITEHRLGVILGRLEKLRDLANVAVREALTASFGMLAN
jgi:hypothetical protein